jgi:predicted TPR repeat methyltransferase
MEANKNLEELKSDIEKFDGFKQEVIEELYDNVAEKYDNMMHAMGHPDPTVCAEFVQKYCKQPADVIDFGCGTGIVGEEILRLGLDATVFGIDASQGMLDVAKAKGCYSQLKHMFLGKPNEFPAEMTGKFDAVTAAGILAEGHLMSEVFEEMNLALKPNGYAIFTTRE